MTFGNWGCLFWGKTAGLTTHHRGRQALARAPLGTPDLASPGEKYSESISRSVVSDIATPWTVACQALLFMGILQARILEWVVIFLSRGSSRPRIEPKSPALASRFFTASATWKAPDIV